jgi:hypothetical protein
VRARVAALPTRTRIGFAAGAVLVYALAVWFLLISPQRAEATALVDDVAAAELRLVEARVAATRPTQAGARVSDVLRLAKAMPASSEQSSIVLELELLGRATRVKIGSIAPGEPVLAVGSPTSIPVVVTAEGSYRQVARFLKRVRQLVGVRSGEVRATGRLLAVQGVDLSESKANGFPRLDAIITINAFAYDGPMVAETPPPVAETDDGSNGSTAAGETP